MIIASYIAGISFDFMHASSTATFLLLISDVMIEKIERVTYSQQMKNLINGLGSTAIKAESVIVIAVNFVIAAVLFAVVFKKKGLE